MSYVTNVILSTGTLFDEEEEKILQEVNKFFVDKDNPAYSKNGFVNVEDASLPRGWYGGDKMLEASLFIGAFNYLNLEGLIEHLQSIQWEYPEDVQLIIKEDGESRFEIINVFDDLPQGKIVNGTVIPSKALYKLLSDKSKQ